MTAHVFQLRHLATLNSSLCVSYVAFNLLARDTSKGGNQVCCAIICHDLELQKHNARLLLTIHQWRQARFEMFSFTIDLEIHHLFLSSSFPWVDTFCMSLASIANHEQKVGMALSTPHLQGLAEAMRFCLTMSNMVA